MFGLLLLIVLDTALWTVNPLIAADFVGGVASGADSRHLVVLACEFLALGLVNQVVGVVGGRQAVDLAQRTTNDLRVDLVDHLLQLDSSYFSSHSDGDLLERADGDTTTLEKYFSTFVFDVLAAALISLTVITVACVKDFRLGVILLGAGLLSVILVALSQRLALPTQVAERRARSDLTGFVQERLSTREDIRASAAENYTLDRLSQALGSLRSSMVRGGAGTRLSGAALNLSVSIALCVILIEGGRLLGADAVTLGTVFLMYQYLNILAGVLFRFGLRMGDLGSAVGSFDRIAEMLAVPTNGNRVHGTRNLPVGPLSVKLDHVTFSYGAGRTVLSDVSLEIPAGRTMALIGPSGSGKSTISKLLWSALDPDSGSVSVNGVLLQELAPGELQRGVGVVTQDTHLLDTTVRDNVTMLDPSVPDERVQEALAAVGLSRWVRSLKDNLDTQLTAGGGSLSTGQMHLIGIARVLVREPQLVILDEIAAHLDPATERVLQLATRRLLIGRTGLIITHKDRGLDEADLVAVMSAGTVKWSGTRESLPADLEAEVLKDESA